MPSREKEICDKVIALVSEGETEQAIAYLERQLKAIPGHDPKLFHDVVLLSNMYNNYERQKLRGTIDDAKEMNHITSEVLELTERIQRNGIQPRPQAATPPSFMNTSPDPLRVVYPQPPSVQAPQLPEKKGLKSRVTSIMAGIGVLFVVLMIIAMFTETEESYPDENQDPFANENIQPAVGLPAPPANAQATNLSSSQIRAKMVQLFHNGEDLAEEDLTQLDMTLLSQQLGNTVWFDPNMSLVSFDQTGASATYLNGSGTIQAVYGTKYGFIICQYAEASTGDYGYLGIVPPGNDPQMTIYVESLALEGAAGFNELQRR